MSEPDYTALISDLEHDARQHDEALYLNAVEAIRDLQERLARAEDQVARLALGPKENVGLRLQLKAAEHQRDEAVEVIRQVRAIYVQHDDHNAWGHAINVLDDFLSTLEPKP